MVAAKFQNDQHDQVAGVLQTVSVAEQIHKKDKRAKEINCYG